MSEKTKKIKKKEHFHKLFSKQANIDYWQSLYDRKDFLGICYRRRMYQALSWLDNTNLPQNSKILDVGCGAGMMVKEVASRGYEVLGIDYSLNMIKRAKAICNVNANFATNFLQADIESLPIKDSVFDAVLCLGVITYLKSEQKALQEMSRILKPGGTMILSSLNKFSLAKFLDISVPVKRRLQKIASNRIMSWKKREGIEENRFAIKSYFIPSLRKALKTAGFTELDSMAVQYGPLTFFGRKIFPEGININITNFLEKFSNMPVIRFLGNMCLFRLKKPIGK